MAAILKVTSLKINRLLPIYISIVPLKFEVDIQSQSKVKSLETEKSNMAARRPFWKWRSWKSIGFCLWPLSTCIWNFKLKFQSKLDLCSGNHVIYRRTGGRTDKVNPVHPPSNFVGRGYNDCMQNGSHFVPASICWYCQASIRSCIKSITWNISRLMLQLSLPSPLKPGFKSRMKM